ncbi:hypothetical protein SLE2022_170650 [Rubroshorea leprosula]
MWVQRGIELFEEDPEYQAKLKQFQKWHPPTFRGTQDTKDANEWIQDLEQIFKVITEQGGKGKAFINHIQPQNKRVEQKDKRKGVFINKVEALEFKVCHQKHKAKTVTRIGANCHPYLWRTRTCLTVIYRVTQAKRAIIVRITHLQLRAR